MRLERYYNWTDGLEAALCKHKSRQRFHEVALKRCMRSQKQIHKAFPKASRNQRKRAFNKFQNEHRSLKNILSKQKEGVSEFLSYQCPHKIGQDYIEGNVIEGWKQYVFLMPKFRQCFAQRKGAGDTHWISC